MVYTDNTHLVADSMEELHKFAKSIGLKREWFQDKKKPHYDLFGSKKKLAIDKGAIQKTSKEIVQILQGVLSV